MTEVRPPTSKPLAGWQLPSGVCRATWDYLQSEHIASEYDSYFADSALMRLDMQILRSHLPAADREKRCVIADLGCGTGRVARQLLPLGYDLINVDLSAAMLREVAAKIPAEYHSRSRCVSANLVDIASALEPQSIDWAVCLFSSLGMIRGRTFRRQFLMGVRQTLKPEGKFFVHVHNRYHSLRDPGGPRWLLSSWWSSCRNSQHDFGDRVYSYRRLPQMFLHIYSRRELCQDLRAAGFRQIRLQPIHPHGDQLLQKPWLLSNWRAGGFFALAQAGAGCNP